MAAAVPFNVVFGINETPLTRALESRRFDEALEFIDSRYGMCLDEGFYQRIPLYIVLSGENSSVDGEAMPVHLKIARRLIERGADPNLRIPETCGAEYIGPGRSPLECVVNFYNCVTSNNCVLTAEAVSTQEALSLNGKCIKYTADLIDELINVAWFLLGHGAEVNVRDTELKTPLHSTLLRSQDLRMAQALCDNGADLMASDSLGNTPLMSVCCPLPWRDGIGQGPCIDHDVSEVVRFLLSFENVKIDHCGIHSRTALFYAMQSGNFKIAKILLDHGADPSLRGLGPDGRYISPLLAAIIPWSSIGRKDMAAVCRELAPLVDKGFFSTEEILIELLEYTSWGNANDAALFNLKKFGISLILMLFGQSTCQLRQLASRMFIGSTFPGEEFGLLCSSEVACLVRRHSLPTELVTDFQIVLLRHKILNALAETDWDFWDVEEFMLDESSEYDESDDEYW